VRFIVDADSPSSSTDVHLAPKADIAEREQHVRFVPKADILRCSKECRYSITSSAWARRVAGTLRAIALRLELD
jgi:hypothetical protein